MSIATNFDQLDLGTGTPSSVPMETVEVRVDPAVLLDKFVTAFINEGMRKAPLVADNVALTEKELHDYCIYLLYQRVQYVHGTCKSMRYLRLLAIPSFIQYTISLIGKVVDRQYGLTMVPVMDEQEILEDSEALRISEKVAAFENVLQIVFDAMPRDVMGNPDVMSTALIAGYVRSRKIVDHVSATYVTAFLNLKLQQEQAFAALYRVQYDDLEFIVQALTTQRIV